MFFSLSEDYRINGPYATSERSSSEVNYDPQQPLDFSTKKAIDVDRYSPESGVSVGNTSPETSTGATSDRSSPDDCVYENSQLNTSTQLNLYEMLRIQQSMLKNIGAKTLPNVSNLQLSPSTVHHPAPPIASPMLPFPLNPLTAQLMLDVSSANSLTKGDLHSSIPSVSDATSLNTGAASFCSSSHTSFPTPDPLLNSSITSTALSPTVRPGPSSMFPFLSGLPSLPVIPPQTEHDLENQINMEYDIKFEQYKNAKERLVPKKPQKMKKRPFLKIGGKNMNDSADETSEAQSPSLVAYMEKRRKNNQAAKRSRDSRRAKEELTLLKAEYYETECKQKQLEIRQALIENMHLRALVVKLRAASACQQMQHPTNSGTKERS